MPSLMHGGLPSPFAAKLRAIAAARQASPTPTLAPSQVRPAVTAPAALGAGQAKPNTLARMGYGGGVLDLATQMMAQRQRRMAPPRPAAISPTAPSAPMRSPAAGAMTLAQDPSVLYAGT
jgi:hypothetical protein